MGSALSSPKDNRGYWNQLRPSKSTFSLKDRNAVGTSSSSSGLFRHSLSGSVSIRKLSQSSFNRRKEKQPQPQLHQQQQQQPSISTISSANCYGADLSKTRSPEAKASGRKQPIGQAANNNNHLHCARHQRSTALTKSTSCYAIKSAIVSNKSAQPGDEKENSESSNDSRKLVIQASTSDLLKCMATFLFRQYRRIACEPSHVIGWIRSIDRSLILQGWADMAFINPPNLVFLFMLMKAIPVEHIQSERQLQATLFTCMYVSYSYMGNEISYPLKPFLIEDDRDAFWDRCLSIINANSSDMLKINSDPTFFIDLFAELKSYS